MSEELRIVLDVGKTVAKISAWTVSGALVERFTRQNQVCTDDGRRVLDVGGIDSWLCETLSLIAAKHRVEAIIPVGHGAAAAILRDGQLAIAPSDYEASLPVACDRRYRQQRDEFPETGSPNLPQGLNLGSQLHQVDESYPDLLTAGSTIVTWAQYWGWRLTGVAATEVSSLGCHTDLWNPTTKSASALAMRRGWSKLLAPLRAANEVLGTLSPEWAARTGLSPKVKVYCGLHDSNAALMAARGFAEIADHESTVLSTGTWFVAMRSPQPADGIDIGAFPSSRDVLVNVAVDGRSVPSARFMGGREIQTLTGVDARRIDIKPDQQALLDAVPDVLRAGAMVMPTFVPGCGPYPDRVGRWESQPEAHFAQRAAVSLYAALIADASLDLIGSRDRLLIEGRFAEAEVFVRALASLRPETSVYVSHAHGDVSYGALRVIDPSLPPPGRLVPVLPLPVDMMAYRSRWREAVAQRVDA